MMMLMMMAMMMIAVFLLMPGLVQLFDSVDLLELQSLIISKMYSHIMSNHEQTNIFSPHHALP